MKKLKIDSISLIDIKMANEIVLPFGRCSPSFFFFFALNMSVAMENGEREGERVVRETELE